MNEVVFNLEICSCLYTPMRVKDVEGAFYANEERIVTAKLTRSVNLQRASHTTISLSAFGEIPRVTIEFRGRLVVEAFDEERQLDFTIPGLWPTWEIV